MHIMKEAFGSDDLPVSKKDKIHDLLKYYFQIHNLRMPINLYVDLLKSLKKDDLTSWCDIAKHSLSWDTVRNWTKWLNNNTIVLGTFIKYSGHSLKMNVLGEAFTWLELLLQQIERHFLNEVLFL